MNYEFQRLAHESMILAEEIFRSLAMRAGEIHRVCRFIIQNSQFGIHEAR